MADRRLEVMPGVDSPVILALTVGGSPEPLRTAIAQNDPIELLLIASDGADGQASSRDEARTLADAFKATSQSRFASIIETPADNVGLAFARIGASLDSLATRHPGRRIIANYTGGTKGMSTALLMAAFQRGLPTQLTTGLRADLRQVASGTEAIQDIDTRLIGLETELAVALRVATHGDYAAAEQLIAGLQRRVRDEGLSAGKLGGKLEMCRDWSRCLAAWDRFDHKTAWAILAKATGRAWSDDLHRGGQAAILEELAKGRDEPSLALCQDLLENARRRQRQGRFDDALARLYRFVEACAQTRLFRQWGLNSGEIAEEDCPAELLAGLAPRFNSRLKKHVFELGLERTMKLLRHKDAHDPLASAFLDAAPKEIDWLRARNRSILAHGYRAIQAEPVETAFAWIDQVAVPATGMTAMTPFPSRPYA